MRAIIYARVSTPDKGQNPDVQLTEIREYCARRGWDVTGEYVDVGVSGIKGSRPELDKMLKACRRRQADAVVVYRYDRFARSLRMLVNALAEFQALGIQFVSIHECVDTTTPIGKLAFGIFATMAEFERDLFRERVKSGMAAARAKGHRLGRKKVFASPAMITNLREQGRSWRQIAAQLGVSSATVRNRVAKKPVDLAP